MPFAIYKYFNLRRPCKGHHDIQMMLFLISTHGAHTMGTGRFRNLPQYISTHGAHIKSARKLHSGGCAISTPGARVKGAKQLSICCRNAISTHRVRVWSAAGFSMTLTARHFYSWCPRKGYNISSPLKLKE